MTARHFVPFHELKKTKGVCVCVCVCVCVSVYKFTNLLTIIFALVLGTLVG